MKRNVAIVLVSVLLSAVAAYFVANTTFKSQLNASGYVAGQPAKTVNLSLSDYPDFTYAAENAVDAVVFVQMTVKSQQQMAIDPFLQFFFGDQFQGQERVQQGSGSGVIIRPDGYIVTNNHVVAGATDIQVVLNNNKTYTATVVGTDPATDVALIKIETEEELPVVQFADSDNLRLGEWVLAIGSPLGKELQSTITAGIVSAKGRTMPNYTGEFKIESFIQTDAAVNPGNSGGALVNKAGELVGINTAIVSTTGSYAGYSFAVPSNIVQKIVSDLIDFGTVKRAKLGVTMSAITSEMAKEYNLKSLEGAYVHEVAPGSTAERAGIKKGDVIVAIDDVPTKTPAALQEKVNGFRPGDKATVKVERGGETVNLECTFHEEEQSPMVRS